jgi:hypothetical protein
MSKISFHFTKGETMKKLTIALVILAAMTGCTQQQMAKSYGGTVTIQVPKGQKVVSATWKEADLWYLTRPMRQDEQPETQTLRESSGFGVMQGTVILQESR